VVEARFKKVDKKLKASFERTWEQGTETVPARVLEANKFDRNPRTKSIGATQVGCRPYICHRPADLNGSSPSFWCAFVIWQTAMR
jgi:hypothetical protein